MTRRNARSDIGPRAVIPGWLLEARPSAQAVRLYAWLDYEYGSRNDLFAWPSWQTLADKKTGLGVSEKTIKRAAKELVQLGAMRIIERTTASGRSTTNDFHLIAAHPAVVSARANGGEGDTCDPLPPMPNRRRDQIFKSGQKNTDSAAPGEGDTCDPLRGTPVTPSSNEPTTNRTNTRAKALGAGEGDTSDPLPDADGILRAIYKVWGWKKRATRQAAAADRKAARELADAGVTPEQAAAAARSMSQDDWWRDKGFNVRKLANDWERWSKADSNDGSILGRDPREDPDILDQLEGL